jgi:hypothetical protein
VPNVSVNSTPLREYKIASTPFDTSTVFTHAVGTYSYSSTAAFVSALSKKSVDDLKIEIGEAIELVKRAVLSEKAIEKAQKPKIIVG